ncbi:MAG: CBS domain-containing protein [Myxococcales bacterium]|nr:CBS domain-containing protein [Myxococcales bacterium]
MTTSPHTIGNEQSLKKAHDLMREHGIRHLPVMHGNRLVGVISDRDVAIIASLEDVNPELITVEDAMTSDVLTVSPEAPLDEVAALMAERKAGSVVIEQNSKVVGIFTTVDGMTALADLLHGRLAS